MLYIYVHIVTSILFFISDYLFLTLGAKKVIGVFAVVFLSILPALQLDVGSDYWSYKRIFDKHYGEMDLFVSKGEYFFVFFVELCKKLSSSVEFVYFSFSLLQSYLIVKIVSYFRRKGRYFSLLVFLGFAFIGTLYHSQLNLIRNSIAIYLFILSILYKFDNKIICAFVFCVLGFFWHQSILIFAIFVFVPNSAYRFVLKKPVFFYFASFPLLCAASMLSLFDYAIVKKAVGGGFTGYVEYASLMQEEMRGAFKVRFSTIFSKLYYVPVNIVFLYFLSRQFVLVDEFGRRLVAFWIVTSNLYLLFSCYQFMCRLNMYVCFFYIVPFLYLSDFFYKNKKTINLFALMLYVFFPYFLKVVVCPREEFLYRSYLFS